MPQTYDLIATSTPAGLTASSFTAIPQTYTDLVIQVSAKVTGAWDIQAFQPNGTASGYAGTYLESNGGGGVTAGTGTSEIAFRCGFIPGTDAPNQFSVDEYTFMNYTSTTHNKTCLTNARRAAMTTNAFGQVQFKIGYLANTAAITSMTFGTANGGTYATNTTIRLYGIKAA